MASTIALERREGLIEGLNGRYHKMAMRLFMAIVLAHWAEHIFQAIQIWVFGWQRPAARGALGLVFPSLVKSEGLHYGYAIVMLVGLAALRPAMTGKARFWWTLALGIQFWHHIEHALLLGQTVAGVNLLGRPMATSVLQLFVQRAELHLVYNAAVFVPMVIAMLYHVWPADRAGIRCDCETHSHRRTALAAANA